jgi:hypothetical protein
MPKKIGKFVYQIICALGALSCILVWLDLKPADVWGWRMSLGLAHWAWLASAIVLFGISLWSSLYSLYRSTRGTNTPEKIEPLASPLTIEQATYGLGGESYQDVTESLRKRIVQGRVNAPVSNSTFDCDPFPGHKKQLEVAYIYNGTRARAIKAEGEQLILPTPRYVLREKVLSLGRDLFAFLREQEPGHTSTRIEAIHYGYFHRFRSRAVDVFNELSANHLRYDIQHHEVDPPQAQGGIAREETIKKIAEQCFLVAARMEIEDESGGIWRAASV